MSSSYFTLILREHGTSQGSLGELLSGTGLSDERLSDTPAITLGQQLRQIRNSAHLLDPTWSLVTGSRLHPSTHGAVGAGAVSASSLGDALKVMTRFSQVRSPHFRLRARLGGSDVRVVPEELVVLTPQERRPLVDIVLLSTQAMIETILGRPLHGARFEVPYAPCDQTARYKHFFHAPMRFGCAEPAIVLPRRWLAVRSPLADPCQHASALHTLAVSERALHGDRMLVARVEHLLARRGAQLDLRTVARLLGVSTRTLNRRLASEATSFRELRDETLQAAARALLVDRQLSVAEVAYALGYEDAANFGRAFRRWFGIPPGQYRRQNAD